MIKLNKGVKLKKGINLRKEVFKTEDDKQKEKPYPKYQVNSKQYAKKPRYTV